LAKSSSNLFRHRAQQRVHQLDLRNFNHVLRINEQERYAEVEGLTTYEELVRETLAFNLLPAGVPQLKSITLGGAISGIGIESSSFKYGFVDETMQELEVLFTGGEVVVATRERELLCHDGEVVVATRENEHRDLFFGFPNSYGTLGYALRVKILLIPINPFAQITHHT